jgi:outer membrane protein OmpA-like peptidoglycan-associated protein
MPGLDDYDGDGEPDPTCGTQDFGAGLVLRIPCKIGTANDPESGTQLVTDSLYRLPGATDVDLTGIAGELLLARDVAGAKVVIVVFNTDGLFDTGSDSISSTDTLDATIRLINAHYAGGVIQVRGHTDATGAAAINQPLSERRAAAVRDYLTAHGAKASSVSAAGLGSSQPLTQETSPDGQRFNRRVEIVIRLPA